MSTLRSASVRGGGVCPEQPINTCSLTAIAASNGRWRVARVVARSTAACAGLPPTFARGPKTQPRPSDDHHQAQAVPVVPERLGQGRRLRARDGAAVPESVRPFAASEFRTREKAIGHQWVGRHPRPVMHSSPLDASVQQCSRRASASCCATHILCLHRRHLRRSTFGAPGQPCVTHFGLRAVAHITHSNTPACCACVRVASLCV